MAPCSQARLQGVHALRANRGTEARLDQGAAGCHGQCQSGCLSQHQSQVSIDDIRQRVQLSAMRQIPQGANLSGI